MTGEQLSAAFERCHAQDWGYVLGANGEVYTEQLAQSWADSKRAGRSEKYYLVDCARWLGHRVADCSGGIVWAIRQQTPGYGDRTANTFASQFDGGRQPVATLPETRGLALWKPGHIGVYVGGGYAVEFRGYAYGCVRTRVADRPWTHWGRLRDIEYPDSGEAFAPLTWPRRLTVSTRRDPLNLRDAPAGAVIASLPKGSVCYGLSRSNGWTEALYDDDERVYRGWASSDYLSDRS